jgi:hypothetical protein
MKEKCVKCKDECDDGSYRTAEGKSFFFCKFCESFLADHPNLSVRDYIGPRFDTWVSKNIQSAHKARTEGKSLWCC